jgi:DNA polymerase zeta
MVQAKSFRSQLEGNTPGNTFGFRLKTQHVSNSTVLQAEQHLKLLSMELFADSRGSKLSHPDLDPVRALVFVIHGDGFPDSKIVKLRVLAVRRKKYCFCFQSPSRFLVSFSIFKL